MTQQNLNQKIWQSMKNSQKPVMLCFPLYPPLELLHSLGFNPIILWGLEPLVKSLHNSDKHLQNYTCSVGRHLMEVMTSQSMNFAQGVFMYNACDTLRNLPEIILQDNHAKQLAFHHIHVPMADLTKHHQKQYLINELHNLTKKLQKQTKISFNETQFQKSMQLYADIRKFQNDLALFVSQNKISFLTYTQLNQKIQFESPEKQIIELQKLHSQIVEEPSSEPNVPRIIISGILPPPLPILKMIEDAGLNIIANDIALFNRSFGYQPNTNQNMTDYYMDFYENHIPCPTLLYTADQRISYLENQIKQHNASGIIFLGEKYCEYETFEFPHIQQHLKKSGVRVLQLEKGIDTELHGEAMRTRIEAFAELF